MMWLLEVIVRYKEYAVLTALVLFSYALMLLDADGDLRGFRTSVVGALGVAQDVFSWVENPIALKSENEALRKLNYELSREVIKTRRALIENDKLRALTELRERVPSQKIIAEVTGKISGQMRNTVTLSKGTRHGLQKGMSVLTERGLVGIINSVSDNYALVQTLPNRDMRVAVKIERTRADGIIRWEGGQDFRLSNISKTQDVQAGDIVVTSSYSTLFPPDIAVGKVIEVADEPNSLFRRITIAPFADFSALDQVIIDTRTPDKERLKLEQQVIEALNK